MAIEIASIWFTKLLKTTRPFDAVRQISYEIMVSVPVSAQTAGEPSRFLFVASQTSTVVVPLEARASAAEWIPSPLESRYMYWARAGADPRRPTRMAVTETSHPA